MFLRFGAPGGGWRVREVGARELASFLCGPSWPGVRRVALVPLPGNSPGRRSISLSAWSGTGSRSASLASHPGG